jgi:hypothetical protein
MLFSEVTTVYCENDIETRKYIAWAKSELVNVKAVGTYSY